MTWDEFKAQVDQKLLDAGRSGSLEIDYIDIWHPDEVEVCLTDWDGKEAFLVEVRHDLG